MAGSMLTALSGVPSSEKCQKYRDFIEGIVETL